MANDTTMQKPDVTQKPDVQQKREAQSVQAERLRSGRAFLPVVDILEKADRLMLVADMPGVRRDEVEIVYDGGQLTIVGKVTPRQDPNVQYLLHEYGVGDFTRAFQIGEGIDAAKIEAELRDGVLIVHLPKSEKLMPRRIPVKPQ